MRVLALAAAAKRIHKRRIAVLDQRIAAVKASMAARRKQAIAMAAAVVAAGEAATEPRREVRRALGKWRGSTVGVYLADGDEKTFKENFRCTRETFALLATLLSPEQLSLCHCRGDTAHPDNCWASSSMPCGFSPPSGA